MIYLCRALGSDTGGSVRIPASYCGVVGFKPTYGSISRWGLVAYASSLDTIGTMTRTVEDTKRLFKVLSKYDHKDPSSIPPDERRLFHQQQKALQPLRSLIDCSIGIPEVCYLLNLTFMFVIGIHSARNHGPGRRSENGTVRSH